MEGWERPGREPLLLRPRLGWSGPGVGRKARSVPGHLEDKLRESASIGLRPVVRLARLVPVEWYPRTAVRCPHLTALVISE